MYITVKMHKPGYPLRPIISQVTTPTYQLTKTINDLITPYLSYNYFSKSTKELIENLKTHKPNKGILSSLNVKKLFTKVPVLETINIIIIFIIILIFSRNRSFVLDIYYHLTLPPLQITSNNLQKILLHCTTEVPFHDAYGNIFI